MREKIGFWEAVSIGIGGMIGGGIFAVLGLSVQLAKGSAPIAFLIAGIVALFTAYSYAKLSLRFPSEGGTIEFLIKAYGTGLLAGGLNILLLVSYVVMIALYSYAFGSYAANALGTPILKSFLIAFVVIFFTVLNSLGAVVSGRAEDLLVAFKLAVLVIVAAAGLAFVNPERLMPSNWADAVSIIAGGMIIFLAYEGFELIANAGGDVEHPKVLEKAFYVSVVVVIAVYVLIAIITVGTLPYEKIMEARDYALAIAAEPALGQLGFWFVTFAALASTSSAINATLYGTARASYMVAKFGELPEFVGKKLWRQAYEGLVVIPILSIILSITTNLETIATAGSGGFLLIFAAVNLAAVKLRRKVKVNPLISSAGAIMALAAFTILALRMAEENLYALAVMLSLIAASFLFEWTYRWYTGREIGRYVDRKLIEREKNLRNWEEWIPAVVDELRRRYSDSEVYLVGSLARGEAEKAGDVDLLVLTDAVENGEKEGITRDIKKKLELGPQHCLDLHFEKKSLRDEALKRAVSYRRLK
ncbi:MULTISPECIES: amino acid permease [Archaeoglobus]|uniref:Cationic amino acid transporter (Cat-2) n=3 Tax=Archaeoglobus fulgidus TaxID=2234 RepID=O28500_ARCFU|nr:MULTISPECIES: amino acid permease [Archaeoglobus]AAB89476.1 cationic amino acid transporter (cat-2) [Archaeoglobus fulgidus DSM 4304]AIG98775.1 Amino acid transporter [Archaeoglobus fulgidus DSM 8774]MDI3496704.1 uncharacterized protein [Archaeoglobus sp.]